jgi:hypothetical protein
MLLVRCVCVEEHHDLVVNDDRDEQPMDPCVRARSSRRRMQRLCSDSGDIRDVHLEHNELIESSQVKAGGALQLYDHNDITCACMGHGFDSSMYF